jgi:hypothetical protein
MHHWLQVLPRCQSSYVVKWSVYVDIILYLILSRITVCVTYKTSFGSHDSINCTLYIHTTRDYR